MDDFLVIENFLPEEQANEIHLRMQNITEWSTRICDTLPPGPRIVGPNLLRGLGMSAQEYARTNPPSLQALAAGGTMAYLFFVQHLSEFDPSLFDWWSGELVNKVNAWTGKEGNYFEEPQVTMYSSGCFLGQHTDGVYNRQVACIANFTRNWQPDFGGCLTILSKDKWQVIPPTFNSLVMMDVRAANCHYVSQVASWVKHKRLAITGWVGRRDANAEA
jgi:hypothetical protein